MDKNTYAGITQIHVVYHKETYDLVKRKRISVLCYEGEYMCSYEICSYFTHILLGTIFDNILGLT